MTPAERVQAAVRHEETSAIPYNFMFTPPAEGKLKGYYCVENLRPVLEPHLLLLGPKGSKPLYASPRDYGDTITDPFGVVWTTSDRDRGYPIMHPLTRPTLRGYDFPKPPCPEMFAEVRNIAEKELHYYRVGVVGDFWERAHFLRGLENLLIDVKDHHDFLEKLLDRLLDYNLKTVQYYAGIPVEALFWSDDYGLQNELMLSPGDWRHFVKPRLRLQFEEARRLGFAVMLHSCGNITRIIPDLIEIGVDILHPIQPEGIDIFFLKKEYGRDLTFCGGISTQRLLPWAAPDAIRQAVWQTAHRMGKEGGYILEPGITLQADIPVENLVALVEAARNYRRYEE